MKKINFFAGPAILAPEVLEKASDAVRNFDDMGLSILEISHRSPQFTHVMEEACRLVKKLLNIGDDYAVLFLTGGASSQFYMTAMNLLAENDKVAYIDTGAWSKKAIKESQLFADVDVVASSADSNYNYIPKAYDIAPGTKYLHYTSNNTIFGTQFQETPQVDVPLIADMSSDIFSRPIDISKYDLIYAGAQKNLGPAGTTLVIVKKDIVNKSGRTIPTILNYQTHIDKGSMFNTPPVYPIYVSMLSLQWLDSIGGVAAMEKKNIEKATLLYDEIDRNPLFTGNVVKEDRSLMNVTFTAKDEATEKAFLAYADTCGLVGLKGHRSVGGFRASIYNAMSLEGVQRLVQAMQDFEKKEEA